MFLVPQLLMKIGISLSLKFLSNLVS